MKKILITSYVLFQMYLYGMQLSWNNDNYINSTNIVVQIWSSTNLLTWELKDTVPSSQTNYTIPNMLCMEFFKIRNVDTFTGLESEWSHK